MGFPVVVLALRFLVERTEPAFVSKASEKPLLRHEVRCARPPPFWRGFSLSGIDSGRVLGFRARSGLRSTSGFTSRQEGFAMQLKGHHLEPRSGPITGDFANRNALIPPLCRGEKIAKWVIFSGTICCPNPICVCFPETSMLSACPAFFDLRVFPLGSAWKVPF